jgi:hypothetical protein
MESQYDFNLNFLQNFFEIDLTRNFFFDILGGGGEREKVILVVQLIICVFDFF